jgi:multidrug efflux pump subunit AcrB
MKRLVEAFTRNTVFANIILSMIFLCGIIGAQSMIREIFPKFSLDMIDIRVSYPGADPEEVEEGISRKIEEALEGEEGIKRITTNSAENVATAMIEVDEAYNVQEVLNRVRSAVDSISSFPVDAEEPIVSEMILQDAVLNIGLSGDMPERRLKEWAEIIKDDLQQLPEISQVQIFGVRDYEISIEVSEEKLQEYGLTLEQVSRAVRQSNLNMAGGTIRTEGEEIRLRTMGRKYTGKELEKIVVLARPQGQLITLDRVATIRDGFTEDPIMARINGNQGAVIQIFKTDEQDTLSIARAGYAYIEEKQKELPAGIELAIFADITPLLQARIDMLVKNGLIGICLVLLILWIFLDIRLSFWAGMGMPISIAGALGILWAVGGSINMISLFSLIMVLGIIVDDAIVVGEAIYVHRKQGEGPLRAAVEGVMEVGLPVIAAVTTTIVAFIPLMFVGGIMGKFIRILPIVVIACLSISLVECLVILPAHLSHLPDPNGKNGRKRGIINRFGRWFHRHTAELLEWFIEQIYRPFVCRAIEWRYVSLSVAITILLLTIGMVRGGIIKYEMFEEIDGTILVANVEFPNGTPPEVTVEAVRRLEGAMERVAARTKTTSEQPLVKNTFSLIGESIGSIPRQGPNLGGVLVEMIESEDRGVHSQELMVAWEEEIGAISGVQSLTITGMEAGPPGAPIEIWVQGRSMDEILAAANDLTEKLGGFSGVYQIRSDFNPGKREIRLALKPEARALGLTVEDLARQVNSGYFGHEALRLQRGRDDIRVKIKYTENERSRFSNIEQVRIRTHGGREIPLRSVAEMTYAPGYSTITRTDGMRRVAVSAEVDSNKANTEEILTSLAKDYFPALEQQYPNIFVSIQGEQEKTRESFSSLAIGYPIALLGIFIIIATIFRSYVQPLIIMVTVPFGIIGAIFGHLLMGYSLSIMSVFGIVALAGVVVNDAIVLIERINNNLAEGMSLFEAIENGGARRFRAIFLTSISTIGGLTPLILETDLQARFMIPMALSIAAGVAFATVLTLVLIPSLLVILNDIRRLVHYYWTLEWPTREAMEPATLRNVDLLEEQSQAAMPPTASPV